MLDLFQLYHLQVGGVERGKYDRALIPLAPGSRGARARVPVSVCGLWSLRWGAEYATKKAAPGCLSPHSMQFRTRIRESQGL